MFSREITHLRIIHLSAKFDEIIYTPLYPDHFFEWEYKDIVITLPFDIDPAKVGKITKAALLVKHPEILEDIPEMRVHHWKEMEFPEEKQIHVGRTKLNNPEYLVSKAKTTRQFSREYVYNRITTNGQTVDLASFRYLNYGLEKETNREYDSLFLGAKIGISCRNEELGELIIRLYRCWESLQESGLTQAVDDWG